MGSLTPLKSFSSRTSGKRAFILDIVNFFVREFDMTATNTLDGKALVVGANGGMGSAIAIGLTRQGVDTAL